MEKMIENKEIGNVASVFALRRKQLDLLVDVQLQIDAVDNLESKIRASVGNKAFTCDDILSIRKEQNEILLAMGKKLDEVKQVEAQVKEECKKFPPIYVKNSCNNGESRECHFLNKVTGVCNKYGVTLYPVVNGIAIFDRFHKCKEEFKE